MLLAFLIANLLFFTSVICDERVCASNICFNGGTCMVDDVSRRFSCKCSPGFSGSLCQETCALECANGVCVKGALGKEQCQCTQGWSGALCEVSGSSLEGCTRTEDCGIGERCIENDRGFKICIRDPCESRPCRNNASCAADGDAFLCTCQSGFAGKLCETDVNECELTPCQHGGTCINTEGSFECLCEPQFTGPQCEQEVVTCATSPCLNQGTCVDTQIGYYCICPFGYEGKKCDKEKTTSPCKCSNPLHKCSLVDGKPTCACPKGFAGLKCSERIRGCDSAPCLNGGRCEEIVGGYKCYCLPEYTGETCETIVPCLVDGKVCLNGGRCIRGLSENHCECPSNFSGTHCGSSSINSSRSSCNSSSCLNGGVCHADGEFTTCECPQGFGGLNCSIVGGLSPTCVGNPCRNGGQCQPVGDPQEDGFKCMCKTGYEGNFCEQEVSEWDSSVVEVTTVYSMTEVPTTPATNLKVATPSRQPGGVQAKSDCEGCVNMDKCLQSNSGPLCVCRPGYQGERCDKPGEPCDSVPCTRPLVCRALIASNGTQTSCGCPIGWSGSKCIEPTAVSFNTSSLFIYQSPSVMIGSSSGPLPYAVLFSFRTTVPTVHIVSGENIFGQQLFTIAITDDHFAVTINGATYSKLIPYSINDGNWYSVKLQKLEEDVLVSVVNEAGYQLLSRSLPRTASFDVFSTRVGKIGESEYFLGCIADFSINEANAIDLSTSGRGTNIASGCKHTVQCSGNPCLNGGSCQDFWTHFTCACKPPFLPPLCMNSLPPSTFGHENETSFVEISVPSETSQNLKFLTTIQFIMRSSSPNGTILFLGEVGDELATFISISIQEGHILVRSRAGGRTVHELKSRKRVDDNKDHVLSIRRQRRQVKLEVDGTLDSEGTMPSRFDHPLFAEILQLASGRNVTSDAFATSASFKGTLQDTRINEKSVVLHSQPFFAVDQLGHVTTQENVLEGMISDDVCAETEQCVHGECRNTFNDFECNCQKGFFGKRCERKDHCSNFPCPTEGDCENVGDGYICTSPVTIKPTSSVSFRLSESVEIGSMVRIIARTHSEQGHILTIQSQDATIKLTLSNRQLVVTGAVRTPILRTIADGQWHTIEISEKIVYVDSTSYGLPEMIQLPSRLHSPTVIFGGTDDSPSFDGCLRDVQIGELPRLSFYRPEEIGLPRNVTYWIPERREKMATGCLSSPQCDEASPCVRGECRDLWNSFTCECPNGFEGQFCELNRNECSQIECDHGQCVDGIGVARCQCDSGYTGEACDVEMDHCSLIPCKNSGLCINSNGSFICECRNGWAGRTCEFREESFCSDSTCRNGGTCEMTGGTGVKCQCRTGFIGPFCEERIDPCSTRPCTNGYCSSSANGFKCDCEEGYSGETCSVLSDFCTESSCNGHGHCAPIWNATMCSCDKNWRGASCLGLVDYCLSIPCENDGTCETVEGGFKCHCRKYYMGDRCQLQGTCLRSPCEKGECMQLTYDTHSCSCPQGYEGSRCEVRINYCKTNSCLNGGSCESLLGGYKCHCVNGFTGTNCETDIDECMQGFCANGAKCRDRVADYECDCDGTGFMGKNCTIDINECVVSNNCVHGRCTNTRGGFRCDCEKGFIGSRCVFRDPCQPDAYNQTTHTCVHGTCINPSVKADSSGRETAIHECKCNRGYTGSQCTTKAFERKMLGMTYVLGPVAAILTVLTILGCVLLAFVLRGKRSLHGHYSPSHQERNGTRMQMNSMVKLPPEERLI
ncbi:hypothetical protein Q1695_000808 [Nippostrongylus brasiliensis]|nr:hypothetical protein Q1695_000808 [Nippostrongylus brasiliensis]